MAARRKEAVKTALSQQPKLAALINDTKELQKQVNIFLTKMAHTIVYLTFSGRGVYISFI